MIGSDIFRYVPSLEELAEVWDDLVPDEQRRIFRDLVALMVDRDRQLEDYLQNLTVDLSGLIPYTLFDAKGDLLIGTGPDAGERLAVGTDYQRPMALASDAKGVVWSDLMETWTGAALPTTGLRRGRMVYATGLTNANFTNRPYIYIGEGGAAAEWQLLRPLRYSAQLSANLTVNAGARVDDLAINLGKPPCNVSVRITYHGAAWRAGVGDSQAKITLLDEGVTGVRHVHIVCPAGADFDGRPTGFGLHLSSRAGVLGLDRNIHYVVAFESRVSGTVFAGDFTECAWLHTVEVF